MTRRQFHLGALAFLARAGVSGARGSELAVIVHRSNRFDCLSCAKLKYLYLRKVSRWPWGAQVEPIDVAAPRSVRSAFLQRVLQTTDEEMAVYWIDQREVHGISPPVQVRDSAAAKALVASRPGAISFIPAADLDDTVKNIRLEP
jgi:hypothetical protein